MTTFLAMQRLNHSLHFRGLALRGEGSSLAPFLGVDHAWMSGPTFPPHRHAGMAAVSYVFEDAETGLDNRDSLGNANLIAPGGLHWFSAGSGAVHEENPVVTGRMVHSLQIFVGLPRALRDAPPSTLSLDPGQMPVVERPSARVRVVMGEFEGTASPLAPPTEVTLLDISLAPGGELTLTVPPLHNAFVLPVAGQAMIDGAALDVDHVLVPLYPAEPAPRSLRLTAGDAPARIAFFAGDPARLA